MRASVGMRVLGMQVGNAFDGKTLTMEQAIEALRGAVGPVDPVRGRSPACPGSARSSRFVVLVYLIYLLYTTAKSPHEAGVPRHLREHRRSVKAARAV